MARVAPITPDQLSEEQRATYDGITQGPRGASLTQADGSLGGPFNAFLLSPAIGAAAEKLGAALRFNSSLPNNLVELAICVTAREWTAQFEWWAHARLAKQAGVDEAIIEAIRDRQTPEFANRDEKAIYTLCRELLDTRRVSDATYERAAAVVGAEGVFEIIALSGYYGLISMTLNVFEVPLPPGVEPIDQ
jgi:4-carboxymuconolactone decarboxylase